MNSHLLRGPSQTGDLPGAPEHPLEGISSSTHSLAPSKSSSSLSAKLRRHGNKVVSALKSLATGSCEQPVATDALSTAPGGHLIKSAFGFGVHKVSSAIFRGPMQPTVVHRASPKGRPIVRETFQTAAPLQAAICTVSAQMQTTGSDTSPNSASTSKSSSSAQTSSNSTAKTSAVSVSKNKSPNIVRGAREQGPNADVQRFRRSPGPKANSIPCAPPDNNLGTIQEMPFGLWSPGIATVERAAAAKVHLEIYFNELLASGPSPRQMRQQILETDLFNRARKRGTPLTAAEMQAARAQFSRRESEYLRELRVMKTRSLRALARSGEAGRVMGYETLKSLGKGSFGVVRLVKDCRSGQLYAMKVINKIKTLRISQEGHLRAERDILVASEGSRWIVPLVASFQDLSNLYLVMEYMPGGDFLSLLMRENILHESVARFYIAEIVLCVEAAHSLKCIHRDIKPDNFLVSASGHLKISDFGLAFDGHWSHDTTYYTSHREDKEEAGKPEKPEKKRSSGVNASITRHHKKDLGDGEPLLNWRNRCGNRKDAWSIVGTSQYMAPEVIQGKKYDARCDWWSVGVILFECIYGHTPFLSEDRHETKNNIVNFRETFYFPPRPAVSRRCQHLMLSLITEKEYRLCSERYRMKDLVSPSKSSGRRSIRRPGSNSSSRGRGVRDFAGRYVFPYDAEDIKAHKWFRNIPWERLHELNPPLVPKLCSVDDTHYFGKVSVSDDPSESDPEDSGVLLEEAIEGANTELTRVRQPCPTQGPPTSHLTVAGHHPTGHAHPHQQQLFQQPDLSRSATKDEYSSPHPLSPWETPVPLPPPTKEELAYLRPLCPLLQELALNVRAVTAPRRVGKSHSPTQALALLENCMAQLPNTDESEKDRLREFVRRFGGRPVGWRPRKRPRDRLLRDAGTKRIALEVRRRTAFLGYEWRRMEEVDELAMLQPGTGMLGGGNVGVVEEEPVPVPLGARVRDQAGVAAGGWGKLKEKNHDGHDSGVVFPAEEGENAHIVPPSHGEGTVGVTTGDRRSPDPILQQRDRRGGFQAWGGDVALLRALHSGPWSLQ
ncbi:uncharacterized protein B0T15DRAFT_497829 [Chaetomium strumarium]|uniref:non-specific serine/threonine protein kinase n=1 Tax=Chaetomium strumarium TaxID=1170767 RepID=A0AAJ0H113_9PEZI|nr:hypothetical protein B0T15DRAFT_497829 [Chaetomium strumarium]